MKKLMFCVLFLSVLVLGLRVGVLGAEVPLTVTVSAENGETVELVPTGDVFYLPASIAPTAVPLAFDGTLSYTAEGETVMLRSGETVDLTPMETTDARGATCYRLRVTLSGRDRTLTFYRDTTLPSLFIETSRGLSYIESSKDNRDKNAHALLLSPDGSAQYSDAVNETESELKGRGNATWSYYKKPYQLKLGEKTALLGMEKSKTWILLAGYTDQSAVHNALAFTLAEALGVPYAIDYRFLSLYIDGEYRGLYMICEKVQVDGSRVDVVDLEKENELANPDTPLDSFRTKTVTSGELIEGSVLTSYTYCEGMASPDDITGGYLVELDNIRGMSEPCRFQTENGNIYVVKSPEYASREEMEYISALFADMEEAIYSETGYNRKGKHYSSYIDGESFAAIYTVQELLKNWDAYLSSMFFFKDADRGSETARIGMGPLWDLDNTLGNINFNREYGTDTAYLWAQDGVFNDYPRGFAKHLMHHGDFAALVETAYHQAYRAVQSYLDEDGWLVKTVDEIASAVVMDRTRWELYDPNRWLLNSGGRKVSVKFVQFAEYGTALDRDDSTALGFLRYYLTERAEALLVSLGGGALPSLPEMTSSMPTEQTTQSSETEQTPQIGQSTSQTEQGTAQTDPTASERQYGGAILLFALLAASVVLAAVLYLIYRDRKRN